MELPCTVEHGTDAASFALFHPDDLAHHYEDELSWFYDAPERDMATGSVVGWVTGNDGGFVLRLTDLPGELPTVPGSGADFLLDVRHGRIVVDNTDSLPSDFGEPGDPVDESLWLTLPNGRYRVRVSLVDAHPGDNLPDYEVLFTRIGPGEQVAGQTLTLPRLEPSTATLGRVVSDWRAHPGDPVLSAYERWLVGLDSNELIAILPDYDHPDVGRRPVPPPRTSAPPTSTRSVEEIQRLVVAAQERGGVVGSRRDLVLAERLLTHAGMSAWLGSHLRMPDEQREETLALPRQRRYDALLSVLEGLAATPLEDPLTGLSPAERALLQPRPVLDDIEVPAGDVLHFRDPEPSWLPGARLALPVPAPLRDLAADADLVVVTVVDGIEHAHREYGYPSMLARVTGWEPQTSTLSAEVVGGGPAVVESVAEQQVTAEPLARGGWAHQHPVLDADVATLTGLVAAAASDPRLAAGPDREERLAQVAGFGTVEGVGEWLLRALPMSNARRSRLFGSSGAVAGAELLAQLRALAAPGAVTEAEADLLATRPWLTAVPTHPMHVSTGEAHLPGVVVTYVDQVAELVPYELYAPTGHDGNLASLAEVSTVPLSGAPGSYEHQLRHLGLVRIVRSHVGTSGLTATCAALPAPAEESVEDIVTATAVARYVTDSVASFSGIGVETAWELERLHSARAVSAFLLRHLSLPPKERLVLAATPPRERLHLLLDRLEASGPEERRLDRAPAPATYPSYQALMATQGEPPRSQVPLDLVPLYFSEDDNFVVSDTLQFPHSPELWAERAHLPYLLRAGTARVGALALLLRVDSTHPETRLLMTTSVALVRLTEVVQAGAGWWGRVEPQPLGAAADLDGVVDRETLRSLLQRAADRDPAVATAWERPARQPVAELAELDLHVVQEDLLRRLPMTLSERLGLIATREDDRLRAMLTRLREIADGLPPEAQAAQRLGRVVDLPTSAVPALPHTFWMEPGIVFPMRLSAYLTERTRAAGHLAITPEVRVGGAVMLTRPTSISERPDENGRHELVLDQLRPVLVAAVGASEQGIPDIVLAPAPSATDATTAPVDREAERLAEYVALLRRAFARDARVTGTSGGQRYRLWQAGRFTSLLALLSWQVGQLGLSAQAVIDLQAVGWRDRLDVLTGLLTAVESGTPLADASAAAGVRAARALGLPG